MTLTDDETQRLYGMGGPCEHWVVRSRYLTPDEVAVVADACISELLTELVHGSRLAARWCDERSDALLRAEQAEAEVERRTYQLTLAIAAMCDNCLAEWKREMRAEQDVPLEEGG